jgi:hypothetical protein
MAPTVSSTGTCGVDPTEAVDVYVIGAEAPQGIGQKVADRHRPAVDTDEGVVGPAQRSELHADHDAVPIPTTQRLADEQLIVPHAVVVAGVE